MKKWMIYIAVVGLSIPLHLFAQEPNSSNDAGSLNLSKKENPLEYFINPVITWKSELQNLGPEGDLSIPDFYDQFYRSKVITLEYVDLKGEKHSEIVEGFTAIIFSHN